MNDHQNFLDAISQKKIVKVQLSTQEKGIIQRDCVPFDFGPWKRNVSPNLDRYHMYDLNSPEGEHNLSILPEQVIKIEITNHDFNPADFITWQPPFRWFVARDWGVYS